MFCENCGSSLQDGAKFCGSCGAKTEPVAPADETIQASTPEISHQPQVAEDNTARPSAAKEAETPSYTPPARPAPAYTAPQPAQSYSTGQSYQPPAPNPYAPGGFVDNSPLGIGQYIGMFLLMAIPLVNLILLFVWGFGSTVNVNKKNFARASLILMAISIVLWIIIGSVIIGIIQSLTRGFY